MLATALKGIPRDSYRLMTKYRLRDAEDAEGDHRPLPQGAQLRVLRHPADALRAHPQLGGGTQRLRDTFSEVKAKKIILAHGASCHGLLPLRAFPGNSGWTSRCCASTTTAPGWTP